MEEVESIESDAIYTVVKLQASANCLAFTVTESSMATVGEQGSYLRVRRFPNNRDRNVLLNTIACPRLDGERLASVSE